MGFFQQRLSSDRSDPRDRVKVWVDNAKWHQNDLEWLVERIEKNDGDIIVLRNVVEDIGEYHQAIAQALMWFLEWVRRG